MITDSVLFIHGTGSTAFGPISVSGSVYGDSCCSAGSQYSNVELDFGAPGSASSYPYVSQFPSLTEKGYTNPPEMVGNGGVPWGLKIQVMSSFAGPTSVTFGACTAATSSAGSTSAIASRTLTLAQLQVIGACYFIPVNPYQVLEFNRFYANLTGGSATAGTIISWYGPMTGGEQ